MWAHGKGPAGSSRLALMVLIILAAWNARGAWFTAGQRNVGFYQLNSGLATGETASLEAADKTLTRLSTPAANASIIFGRSLAYLALGRPTQAGALWRSHPASAAWLLAWGQKRLAEEKYSEARTWFERLEVLEPERGDAWYYAGLADEGQQAWQEAGANYALALSRDNLVGIGSSDVYLRLGYLAVRARAWQDAEGPLAQALALNQFLLPENAVQAHFYYAEALFNLGRLSQAQTEYGQVLALAPRHYTAHIRLAALAWQLDHDAVQAEQLYQAATQLAPTEKAAYKGLGDLYRETGHVAEARAMYQHVLSLDPKDNGARRALEGLPP